MPASVKTITFQEAIESVERLSPEDQEALIELIDKRLAQYRRNQLVERVREARASYERGDVKRGTVADFMAVLDSDE